MSKSISQSEALFEQGIRAVQEKRFSEGQALLRQSLALDPYNDEGWMWLSMTTNDPQRKLKCVENALKANPKNAQALKLKRELQSGAAVAEPYASPVSAPKSQASARTSSLFSAAAVNAKPITEAKAPTVTTAELGSPLLIAGDNRFWQFGRSFLMLLCFALAGFAAYMAVNRAETESIRMIGLVIAGLMAIGGVFCLITLVMSFGQKVTLYENGIAAVIFGQERAFRWSQFTDLSLVNYTYTYRYIGIPIYRLTMYDLKLFQDKDQVLKITNSVARFREIGDYVLQRTQSPMLKRAVDQLKQGSELQFGGIKATRSGLSKGRSAVSWQDLSDYEVNNGWIKIFAGSRLVFRHNFSKMKNAHVLMALCDQLRGRGLGTAGR